MPLRRNSSDRARITPEFFCTSCQARTNFMDANSRMFFMCMETALKSSLASPVYSSMDIFFCRFCVSAFLCVLFMKTIERLKILHVIFVILSSCTMHASPATHTYVQPPTSFKHRKTGPYCSFCFWAFFTVPTCAGLKKICKRSEIFVCIYPRGISAVQHASVCSLLLNDLQIRLLKLQLRDCEG